MTQTGIGMPIGLPDDDFARDLLPNTRAIASFLGISDDRARRLCRENRIPRFKLGKQYAARRSSLVAAFAVAETGGADAA